MSNCYHHALSSAKHFGGIAEDYQAIHDWFDESKKILPDHRHRALRHHAEGCFAAQEKFGVTITNSDGKGRVNGRNKTGEPEFDWGSVI